MPEITIEYSLSQLAKALNIAQKTAKKYAKRAYLEEKEVVRNGKKMIGFDISDEKLKEINELMGRSEPENEGLEMVEEDTDEEENYKDLLWNANVEIARLQEKVEGLERLFKEKEDRISDLKATVMISERQYQTFQIEQKSEKKAWSLFGWEILKR